MRLLERKAFFRERPFIEIGVRLRHLRERDAYIWHRGVLIRKRQLLEMVFILFFLDFQVEQSYKKLEIHYEAISILNLE